MSTILEQRIKMDNDVLKRIRREILKSAKKGNLYYYWEVTGLNESTIRYIVDILESEGKMFKNKGSCKIIRW